MKERTLRFILDSIFCMDAMSPEFKKANDILLRIVKMNDRTDGLPHTRLVEINKAFKENDAKAARVAFDKLKPLLAKGDKDLQDGLTEARSKLSEASQKAEQTKAAAVAAKGSVALFDKFRKAIDGVKAKPASVPKLSAYADKLKAYGDFSKRIAQMSQMVAAKKDVSKQVDMLAAACDKGKAKADKERVKAEKDYGAAKDRVSVFKEMEKIRSKKIAEFAKEREDVQKLGAALPAEKKNTTAETLKKMQAMNKIAGSSIIALDPNEPPGAIDMRFKWAIREGDILYGKLADIKKKVDDIFKVEDRKYKDVQKDIDKGLAAIDAARTAAKKPFEWDGEYGYKPNPWTIDDSEFEKLGKLVEDVRFESAWKLSQKLLEDVLRVYSTPFEREHASTFIKAMQKLENTLMNLDFDATMDDFSTRPDLPSSSRKAIKEKYIDLYARGTNQKIVDLLSSFGVKEKDAPKSPSTFMAKLETVRKKLLG